jgi:hypothetical protein
MGLPTKSVSRGAPAPLVQSEGVGGTGGAPGVRFEDVGVSSPECLGHTACGR